MGRTFTKGILAAILALSLPMTSWAAGLGRLTVHSPLGQPLNAEIEIVSLQPGEEEGLNARLPSNEAFRQAGIELNPALLGVRFAIERRDGRAVVRLSTTQPVNEPFVDLLVELQWNTGRLVREYTFLLDPPNYRSGTAFAEAPAPTPVAKPVPAPVAPAEATPQLQAQPQPLPAVASAPAAPEGQAYEVKRGDTLYQIAREHLPAGASLEQMLAALYNANRQAFIAGNMNLMRTGEILNIPGAEAVGGIGSDEARRLVQSQGVSFQEYRKRLAASPMPAEAAPGQRETTGRIEPKPEATPPAPPQDQLKLAKAEPGAPAGAVARAAQGDDRVAGERALQEAQSRVAELEKNVADLQNLLALRNQQLAELERRASAAAPAVAATAVAEAPKPAAEAQAPALAAAAPVAAPEAEAPKPVAEAPKPSPQKAATEFKSTKPRAKAAPLQEPSLLDELLENPLALGGLLLVLALLIGYGAIAWRRRKAGQARFQDSVLSAASAPAAAGPAGAGPVSSQISSQSPVSGMEPEEVDPIAEADVYMAYGRDSQAEEILREALQKDPNRAAIHVKLLEIYANRRDKSAFEQSALKLKGLTNGVGPEWEKAAALGRSLDSQSGLYGAAGASVAAAGVVAAAPAPTPTLDFDLGGGTTQQTTLPDISLDEAKETRPAIDFDLGASTGENQPAKDDFTPEGTLIMGAQRQPESALAGLDFNLDLSAGGETFARAASSPAAAPSDAAVSMDFDLNLDLGGSDEKSLDATAHAAPLDLSSIDLDLSEPATSSGAASSDPKWQEVATKLDLAKAYEEMGDRDGARELLAEVVREGDAAQKGEAELMLAKLG